MGGREQLHGAMSEVRDAPAYGERALLDGGRAVTCPGHRDIPTGFFGSERISCAKPDRHKGAHRSGWIAGMRLNELTQTKRVRVEWVDA